MQLPVSVILPVHNGARFVGEAIKSVLVEPVCELIIVDDGSTDGTADAIRAAVGACSFTGTGGVQVIRTEHRGVGHARNVALGRTSCSFIACIDADDVWVPGKTKKQLDALRANGANEGRYRAGYAASLVEHFLEDGFVIPETLRTDKLGTIELPFPSNLITQRDVFIQVGGFDPDLVCANDVDWYRRATEIGIDKVVVPEVLVRKRVHDENLSLCQGHDMQRQIFQVIKRKVEPGMFPWWK